MFAVSLCQRGKKVHTCLAILSVQLSRQEWELRVKVIEFNHKRCVKSALLKLSVKDDTGCLAPRWKHSQSFVRPWPSVCVFIRVLLRVVSGSRDATLRVWDIETGQCLHVLMGHVAAVRCVQYDGRRVVSGAYDFMVKVWDPETETCLHTLQGHTNRVYSLQVSSLSLTFTRWNVCLCSVQQPCYSG